MTNMFFIEILKRLNTLVKEDNFLDVISEYINWLEISQIHFNREYRTYLDTLYLLRVLFTEKDFKKFEEYISDSITTYYLDMNENEV